MSELPETFSVKLQRHGENWHTIKLHEHQYPGGRPDEQPRWEVTVSALQGIGYEVVSEAPGSHPGERRVQMARRQPVTVIDRLSLHTTSPAPKPAVALEPTAPMPAKASDTPAPETDPAKIQAEVAKKFGRL